MRNRLRFRSDSSESLRLKKIPGVSPEDDQQTSTGNLSFSQLATTLSVRGGAASADLALDIILNEIAELVRIATDATGAAVALTRSGELVCRATTGRAPDLGASLDPYSGLSGLCLQTRIVQHCDDTETDPRVDVEACRVLEVRSILVVPLIRQGEVAGLLEVFSSNPNHFESEDAKLLEPFCRDIVTNIDRAVEAADAAKLRTDLPPETSQFQLRKLLKKRHTRVPRNGSATGQPSRLLRQSLY